MKKERDKKEIMEDNKKIVIHQGSDESQPLPFQKI